MKKVLFKISSCILLLLFTQVGFLHAQQFKIGKNLQNIKSSAVLELEDTNKALLLTRVANPLSSIALPWKGMIVFDSTRNELAYYNGTTWSYPGTKTGIDSNIYNTNGSLASARTVTMAANNLTFNSTNGNFIYNPSGSGKMGIGTTSPTQKLTIGNPTGSVTPSATPDAITLGNTYSNTAGSNLKLRIVEATGSGQVWGFGVSNGQMDYVVPSSGGHAFYVNGSTATPAMKIASNGAVNVTNGVSGTTPSVSITNTANASGTGISITASNLASTGQGFTGVSVSSTAKWQTTLITGSNVNGSNTASYDLSILGTGQGFGKLGIYNGKSRDFGFIMDSTNKIGISIKDPISRLHVSGAVRADSLVLTRVTAGASTDSILTINATTGAVRRIAANTIRPSVDTNIYSRDGSLTGNRTVTMAANNLIFNSVNGNFIYNPTGTGKMGIGTTAPYTNLDVVGDIYMTNHRNNSLHDASERGTRRIGQKAGNTDDDGFNGLELSVDSASSTLNEGNIKFITWRGRVSINREVARINGMGNMGIGTATPISRLQVMGTLTTDSLVLLKLPNGTSGDSVLTINNGVVKRIAANTIRPSVDTNIYSRDGSLTGNRTVTMAANNLIFNSANGNFIYNPTGTGKMGIGTATPVSKLHVSGGAVRADSLVLTNVTAGANTDSILTINTATGAVRRIAATTIKPSVDTNIYSRDGSLTGNRTVTMGNNNLIFTTTGGIMKVTNTATTSGTGIDIAANDITAAGSGFVGVNVSSAAKWQTTILKGSNVNAADTASYEFNIMGSGQGFGKLGIYNGKGRGYAFVIDTVSNVGIGNTAPTSRLHITKPGDDSVSAIRVDYTNNTAENVSGYGLLLGMNTQKATAKNGIAFYSTNTNTNSNKYMGSLWNQVGTSYNAPVIGFSLWNTGSTNVSKLDDVMTMSRTAMTFGSADYGNEYIAYNLMKGTRKWQMSMRMNNERNGLAFNYTPNGSSWVSSILFLDTTGRVGIGNNNPTQKLTIGNLTSSVSSSATPDAITLGSTYSNTAGSNLKLRIVESSGGQIWGLGVSSGQMDYVVPSSSGHAFYVNGNVVAPAMKIMNTGNIGIGTTAPYTNLDVVGNIYMTNHQNNSLHNALERGTRKIGQKAGNTTDGFNGLELSVDSVTSSWNEGNIKFITWRGGVDVSREVARINGMGNMGIGTATPVSRLQVMGTITTDSLVLLKLPNGSSGDSILSINNGVVKRIAATTIRPTVDTNIYSRDGSLTGNRTVTMGANNLIFTTTGGIMKVTNTANTNGNTGIDITANNVTTDKYGFTGVNVSSTAKWQTTLLKGSNVNGANTASYDFNIMGAGQGFGKLGIYNGKANGYGFVMDTTNKIGISVSNPISRLHVSGAVRADSLVLTNVTAGANTDSILTINTATGAVRRIAATTIKPSVDTNIYSRDGSLTGNRTVTMENNNLTFSSVNGNFIYNPTGTGKMGIGITNPLRGLQVAKGIGTDSLFLAGAGAVLKMIKGSTTNASLFMEFYKNGTSLSNYGARSAYFGFGGSSNSDFSLMNQLPGFVRIGTNDAVVLNIDTFGKVGIGTATPVSKLQVSGAVRTDSVVLLSNSLYKPLNIIYDSVAILDSVGRLMKVGVSDILNSATPPVDDFDWVVGSTNRWRAGHTVGGQTSTYGINSSNYSNDANGYVQMANYMYAKDTVVVKCDVFPGDMGGNQQGYYLILLEYSDVAGTLVSTDTLMTFVGTIGGAGNTLGPGLISKTAWNNDLVYGKKLDDATRYIKVKFLSSGINVAFNRGFKNVSVSTPTVSANSLNYVQGGNSFGTQGMLGLTDKNNLSLITNNVNRILIDTVGNVGIGNTAPTSRLHITKPGEDSISAIRVDYTNNTTAGNASGYGLLLGMNTGNAASKNGIAFYSTNTSANSNKYMGSLWNQVGNGYNAPVIGFSLWNTGSTNISKLDDVMTMNRTAMTFGSADYGDEYIAYNLMRGTRRWQMSMRMNNERNGLAFNYTPNNGSSWVSNLLFLDTSGRVGIGTNNPTERLTIGDVAALTSSASPDALSLGKTYSNAAGKNLKIKIVNDGNIASRWGFGVSSQRMDYVVPSSASHVFYTDSTERVIMNSTGVGIGTTAPYAKLDVVGDIYLTQHAATGAQALHNASERGTRRIGQKAGNTNDGFNGLELSVDSVSPTLNEGNIKFITWRGGVKESREVARINGMGNMGIGTNNPISRLHVTGAVRADSLVLTNVTAGANTDSILTINAATGAVRRIAATTIKPSVDTNIYSRDGSLTGNRTVTMAANNLIFNSVNGNFIYNPSGSGKMGIGTTNPTQKLTIGNPAGSVTASATPDAITLGSTYSNAAGSNLKLRIVEATGSGQVWGFGVSNGQMDYVVPTSGAHAFYVNGNVATPAMKIASTGAVNVTNGVNGTTPSVNVENTANASSIGINITGNNITTDATSFTGVSVSSTAKWQTTLINGSNVNGTNKASYDLSIMGTGQGFGKLGIYNGKAGSFGFVMDSTNKIGISVKDPISRLHVSGAVRADSLVLTGLQSGTNTDNILVIDNNNNVKKITAVPSTNIYTNDGTLGGNRTVTMATNNLTFNSTNGNFIYTPSGSGKMGIGIANPSNLLHVEGTAQAKNLVLTSLPNGTSTDNILVIDGSNNVKKISAVPSTNIYTADGTLGDNRTVTMANRNLTFTTTGGAVKVTNIGNTNGNIGIDITANSMTATGNGFTGVSVSSTAPWQTTLLKGSNVNGSNTASYELSIMGSGQGFGKLGIYNGKARGFAFVIDTTNKIGIGNTSPTQKLTIGNPTAGSASSSATPDAITLGNTFSNTAGSNLKLRIVETNTQVWGLGVSSGQMDYVVPSGSGHVFYANGDITTPAMKIMSSGNVGIGTASPSFKLDVNGNMRVSSGISTTRVQGVSDERLKKDISPIQNALSIVLQLKGVSYAWRKDMQKEVGYTFKDGRDYGVIAQEIQKVLPELVAKDAKGYLTVDYQHITPVLIEAIKEQQTEIQSLKNELQELKSMMQEMKQLIQK